MTYQLKKNMGQSWGYNLITIAATFNSIVCTTSAGAILADRWYMRGHAATVDANDVFQFNFVLPTDYVAGTDIVVKQYFTYIDATGGTIAWGCGLTRDDTIYGGETETAYLTDDWTAPITSAYDTQIKEWTFTGTNFKPMDPIALIIYRDTRAASADDVAATVYTALVDIVIQ